MKRILLTIVLMLWAGMGFAQSKSVSISSGHQAPVLSDDLVGVYNVSGSNKLFHYRGNLSSMGAFKLDSDGHYLKIWPAIGNHKSATISNYKRLKQVWLDVEYHHTLTRRGTKDEFFISSPAAPTEFSFYIDTDLPILSSGDTLYVGDTFVLPAAWAKDADGNSVAVTTSLTGPAAGIYTMTITVDHIGAVYPVYVDPTATVASAVQEGNEVKSVNADWATARGTLTGTVTTQLATGRATNDLHRGSVAFVMSGFASDTMKVDSVRISLWGGATGGVDYASILISGDGQGGSTDTDNFKDIVGTGWQTGVITYTTPVVADSALLSTTLSVDFDNVAEFNSIGIALVQAALGTDTLFITFIADFDYTSADPSGDKFQTYQGADGVNPPFMTIIYSEPLSPGIDTLTALTDSTIRVVYDIGEVPADTVVFAFVVGTDTTQTTDSLSTTNDGLIDTITVAFSDSSVTAVAWNVTGQTYFDTSRTVQMLAQPSPVEVFGYTQQTVRYLVSQGRNQLDTPVAVVCSTSAFGPVFLTTSGDTSVTDTSWADFSVWQTADTILSSTVFSIADDVTLWGIAKNRTDSLVSDRGTADTDSTFAAPVITNTPLDSTSFTYTILQTFVPSWVTTLKALVTGTLADADSAFTDTVTITPGTLFSGTTPTGGNALSIGANSRLAPGATLILNDADSVTIGNLDSLFTLPELTSWTFGWVRHTDTSAVVTVDVGVNPGYQLFGFIDSTLALAGSTKVWYGITELSATAIWFDSTYFTGTANDTLIWVRGSGNLPSVTNKVQLHFASGDSLAQGLK